MVMCPPRQLHSSNFLLHLCTSVLTEVCFSYSDMYLSLSASSIGFFGNRSVVLSDKDGNAVAYANITVAGAPAVQSAACSSAAAAVVPPAPYSTTVTTSLSASAAVAPPASSDISISTSLSAPATTPPHANPTVVSYTAYKSDSNSVTTSKHPHVS